LPETVVVDCSVAAKWILQEADPPEALRLLDEQEADKFSLIAPDLLLTEFASLIAKRVRRARMPVAEGHRAFGLMRESRLKLMETRQLLEPALELALYNQMSLWDCVYLALAIERNCALITADRRLFRGRSARHPSIRFLGPVTRLL
jgi:predicted nucleic acid-binding protein